jgi:RNA polymerase sigma-70 factor (ECF subfamily)
MEEMDGSAFALELARRGAVAPADLPSRLALLLRAARAAWPEVALDDESFAAHLAERWPAGATLAQWLEDAHATDLYLACACGRGVPEALAAVDRAFLAHTAAYLVRLSPSDAFVEDVRQTVREKLFVGDAPKIREYSGRGPLDGWLRVVAGRAALDLRKRRGERLPDLTAKGLDPFADPELGYLKQRYRGVVEDAYKAALASLDEDSRTLLRQHFLLGVTLDELAERLRVHRTTIARRLAGARQRIADETQRLLRERLALSGEEFASLFGLVRSQLDVSVSRLLDS